MLGIWESAFTLALAMVALTIAFGSSSPCSHFLSGVPEVFFARLIHSTTEFAKTVLRKYVTKLRDRFARERVVCVWNI